MRDCARMLLRARATDDIDALCRLVRVIHESDGYPTLLRDDVQNFVVTTNCLAAWVCERDHRVVGHIALHTVWSNEVAGLAVRPCQVVDSAGGWSADSGVVAVMVVAV